MRHRARSGLRPVRRQRCDRARCARRGNYILKIKEEGKTFRFYVCLRHLIHFRALGAMVRRTLGGMRITWYDRRARTRHEADATPTPREQQPQAERTLGIDHAL
jgi:hypothetical protein